MAEPWESFGIGWDRRDRARIHELVDEVLDSGRWSEGPMVARFEEAWAAWNGADAVATSSWAGGALAALAWAGVAGEKVLVPSNTFMATPLAVIHAGGTPVFGDCNREDLCLSLSEVERGIHEHRPRAVFLVHIGGHIAFEVDEIAALCRAEGVALIEDCAHAHGAEWNGRKPGTWGDAGVFSLYATKTVTTGEGGVLVSRNPEILEFARAYRNYGKPGYEVQGLNYRMNELTAALGVVQAARMEEIARAKDRIAREVLDARYAAHLQLPDGMLSGRYKYVCFQPVEKTTGKVYDMPCHRILQTGDSLPNSDWVAEHHWCPPLYYRAPGETA